MRARGVTGNTRVVLDRWEVAAAPAGSIGDPSGLGGVRWIPATVPGTAAGALRAAGEWSWDDRRAFDREDWWWRVSLAGGRGVLGLDGIATLWDAWLDGVHVASGDSMFRAHELAIDSPAYELVIRCRAIDVELDGKRPRPRWRVPMLEQQQLRWIRTTLLGRTPGWSPPYPAVGPWRPAWLERRVLAVGDVAIDARLEGEVGVVELAADLGAVDHASIVVTRGNARVIATLASRDGRWRGSALVPKPARWWPHTHGEPARYHVAIEVMRGGESFTIALGATGFRTIVLDRGDDGRDFAIRINDVPVFCRGACWTPLDVVTLGATPEQIDRAVIQMRDAGMNMLRIGGTMVYEADALHDALDAHGVMLWQDLMFANMDYPDDPAFTAGVVVEVDEQLARLAGRPALAIVCGNSEGEQQAAMWGASRDRWASPLFHETIPAVVAARVPRIPYTPSSAHGGAFPHAANAGPSSYYGVGAYLRPLDDARRSEVRFASECLAFANLPATTTLARTPQDLGAGWNFADVRDHYLQRLYGVDPVALRSTDHDRYLALGRAVTGEVMAQTFGEWRRARSTCRGGLIWFLRDLWPGAGWGVIDAHGVPKPCWYALRRALAPIALAITDEGTNGLAIHVANDRETIATGRLELVLWRSGEIEVGRGAIDIAVPARGALEIAAGSLFDHFVDLSYAYRFGPVSAHVIHATFAGVDAFWFPAGLPSTRELDVGLAANATIHADHVELVASARRFAQSVTIDLPGFLPDDDGFHLAPGQRRTIVLRPTTADALGKPRRGTVHALNAEVAAKIAP